MASAQRIVVVVVVAFAVVAFAVEQASLSES
jgi:hypothetical protein